MVRGGLYGYLMFVRLLYGYLYFPGYQSCFLVSSFCTTTRMKREEGIRMKG